jgi:hypothetical protein
MAAEAISSGCGLWKCSSSDPGLPLLRRRADREGEPSLAGRTAEREPDLIERDIGDLEATPLERLSAIGTGLSLDLGPHQVQEEVKVGRRGTTRVGTHREAA